ncbi:MAG: hypothetical protein ACO1N0_12850 [Fluviicola sp.]
MLKFIKNLRLSSETLLRIFLLSKWSGILKSTSSNPKKTCVIVGNGPSFKDSFNKYKNELNQHDLVCVNNFAASDYFLELKPRYYIINATIVFLPDSKQSKIYQDFKREVFGNLRKTSWDMEIMVPFSAKKSPDFQQLLADNNHLKPIYFNLTSIEGFSWFKNLFFNMGLGTPRPHNVIIPAIMNMIYLKYRTIIITGADHSWLGEISVSDNNVALINQKHFYDENESKAIPMNDYQIRPRRLHEILEKFQLTFKGYWEINEYIENKNVKIYNCSEVSLIDAFERKKLNELS